MTYGIPMKMFPLTDEGGRPLDDHRNWVAKQRTLESITSTNDEPEVVSGSSDILGRRSCDADRNFLSGLSSDMDVLAAKEELELRFSDIHFVSDAIDETPEFLDANLVKLEIELANMSKNSKEDYLQADAEDNRYTRCRKLRLKFLRAESFDAKKAAERLARFFTKKLELFGPELLVKDVKLSDLDGNDTKCLESGIGQLLPQRDRAGRCMFAWVMANGTMNNAGDTQIAKTKVGVRKVLCFYELLYD